MNSVEKPRHKLVHFLAVGSLEPLCGGAEVEASGAEVNGISVCAVCARRLTEQVERAPRVPTSARRPAADGSRAFGTRSRTRPGPSR